jgi:hypothetical protein
VRESIININNQSPIGGTGWLGAMIYGEMLSAKNFTVNVIFDGEAWITGKPRSDQKTIITFGELIIFLGLVGLSAPAGSHYCT